MAGLDNGRGSTRARVFAHAHEAANGRTSCISQHIVGFDSKQNVVHEPEHSKNRNWKAVMEKSERIVTLIDLAGHELYLKTTITGLCGTHPHFALVIVKSTCRRRQNDARTSGNWSALDIPFACLTKWDLAPANVLYRTMTQLNRILKSQHVKKLPYVVREQRDVLLCADQLNAGAKRVCPILTVSSVTGKSIDLLTSLLGRLRAPSVATQEADGLTEVHLEETWLVAGVGLCVSGTVIKGTVHEGQTLNVGPDSDGSFRPVTIKSIHFKRVAVPRCTAGLPCAVSLKPVRKKQGGELRRAVVRRGMVCDPAMPIKTSQEFDAEVLILHHPTTIKLGYQAVIHCSD